MPKIIASLRIMGADLNPDLITAQLGCSPDKSHRTGDPNIGASGRRYSNFSEGIWMIESTVGREASLDEHLKSLLGRIAGREGHFREWIAQGYRADILIGVFGKNDQLGFSLPPETLREIGRFELALDFDIYA